jgi:hypothetical protein
MKKEASPGTVKKTVSLPAELAEAAEKRAGEERRNFSNYLQSLIARDLASADPQRLSLAAPASLDHQAAIVV